MCVVLEDTLRSAALRLLQAVCKTENTGRLCGIFHWSSHTQWDHCGVTRAQLGPLFKTCLPVETYSAGLFRSHPYVKQLTEVTSENKLHTKGPKGNVGPQPPAVPWVIEDTSCRCCKLRWTCSRTRKKVIYADDSDNSSIFMTWVGETAAPINLM